MSINPEHVVENARCTNGSPFTAGWTSCHQLVRQYGQRPEEIFLVTNDGHRDPMEFTDPGATEPLRPATEGLVLLAEALIAGGLHVVDLTVDLPSGTPAPRDLERALVDALTTLDRRATGRIVGYRSHPVLKSIVFRAPNSDLVRVTRGGSLECTQGPNTAETLSIVLESVRRVTPSRRPKPGDRDRPTADRGSRRWGLDRTGAHRWRQ